MQSVASVGSQSSRQASQSHRAVVRLQKLGIHLVGRTHAIRAQQQVANRHSFERPEVARVLFSGLVETTQCLFESLARSTLPEMPALLDEILTPRHLQAVAQLGTAADPGPVFLQNPLYFGNRDRHRIWRN